MAGDARLHGWRDIRAKGFADRAPCEQAWAWLDAIAPAPGEELLAPAAALGRVLAAGVTAPKDLPPTSRAAIDGYAVSATDTAGAGSYNPVPLMLDRVAGSGRAAAVCAGATLPDGADAVLGFGAVLSAGSGRIEALGVAAPGEGVDLRASALRAGSRVLPAGHRLGPPDLALFAMLGLARAPVLPRPRVLFVLPGPKESDAEALSGMLAALVGRDGGQAIPPVAALPAAAAALAEADVIVVAGGSGAGEDDAAAPALIAAGGSIALHGIALRPGASSGFGRLGSVPVLLLPGEPLACLTAYDMLAGRLLRRLAGLSPALPYATVTLPLARKIVSAIGFADVVPVTASEGRAAPLATAESVRLPAARRAAGFVIVPETLEGHAPGETVTVHLYGECFSLDFARLGRAV